MSSQAQIEDANVGLDVVGNLFDVECCPRCFEEHPELAFQALAPQLICDAEPDPYVGDFWGNCPVSGQWLLLRSAKVSGGGYEVTFDLSEPT